MPTREIAYISVASVIACALGTTSAVAQQPGTTPGNAAAAAESSPSAPTPTAVSNGPAAPTPAGSADAQAGASAVQEISVTARRRSENLERVPVAITAFGSA